MSRLSYFADFATIPALILLLIVYGTTTFAGLLLGIVIWTAAEYAIHRVLFHRLPVFKLAHNAHHARPSARTGVSSWQSIAIFGCLALLLPSGVLAGLALGYFGYILAHHAVHHWRIAPGHPLYRLKLRHALHHRGVEANFGVVTTLWDRAFGTFRPHC